MVDRIINWNGDAIRVCQSKGGTTAVCDYLNNLVIPPNVLWPHQDVVKKLYNSRHLSAFFEPDHGALTENLGFYCDLQSVNSEDAITWSVFGTLQYYDNEVRCKFVNALLKLSGSDLEVCETIIQLWTRIAHPDTLVSGGPELDFHIITDKVVIFGEAKWGSSVATLQGKNRDKDQLQLRAEYFEKYGHKIYPNIKEKMVLLVSNDEENESYPSLKWGDVCSNIKHPLDQEIARFFKWKQDHSSK